MADGGWLLVLFAIFVLLDMLRKAGRGDARARDPQSFKSPSGLDVWMKVLADAGAVGRHAVRTVARPETSEDRESLEVTELERLRLAAAARGPRRLVDLDEESRAVAARRLKDVERRSAPHSRVSEAQRDAKAAAAKRGPDTAPSARVPDRAAMLQAMKWREILDRPVGWRDE